MERRPRRVICCEPRLHGFPGFRPGYPRGMELSLLLIIIGIVLAVFVHYALGIVLILIGLVLLIWPRIAATRRV
jgi:hypothetical protein